MRRVSVIWFAAVVIVAATAFVASSLLTDRPGFCSSCHEMRPYVTAWSRGAHHDVWCIDCHVGRGLGPRFAHKFVALGEVRTHFFGRLAFPLAHPADVPRARCTRCHRDLPEKVGAFPHAQHVSHGTCADCHDTAGHAVTSSQLRAEGVYAARGARRPRSSAIAVVGGGAADLPGHVPVVCTRCHDMAKTGCAPCHRPPHADRGDCAQCHKVGPRWSFSHPSAGEHDWRSRPCAKCHPSGTKAVYCTCHKGRPPRD